MITTEGHQTGTCTFTDAMACIPSPVQTLEDPMYCLGYDELSMYDPHMVIKSEPDKDFSCTRLSSYSDPLASPLPSFDQTFYNPYPYSSAIDRSGLQSWTAQHPEHWSSQDVLDWVYFVAEKNNWDTSQVRGEHFQNITGVQLCRMQREEFISRDPTFGACIYDILQDLLTNAKFSEPKCDTLPIMAHQSFVEDRLTDISNSTCTEDGIKVLIGGDIYDIDIKIPIEIPGVDSAVEPIDPGYYSESSTDFDRDSDSHSDQTEIMDMDPFSHDMDVYQSCLPPKYRGHSESLSSLYSDTSEETESTNKPPAKKTTHRGRPAGQASKGNHLWEFIRDTLKDSNFNPALLKWENKEEGVFRFVQSEAVAQMWGRKKNNKGMTYEKLSRAMRYYYKRGILDRVDGKRLVYKFGKNSHGWKN